MQTELTQPGRPANRAEAGAGFGDTASATENCLILERRIHKLDQVRFDYDPGDYNRPWNFSESGSRLALQFTPFKERVARTNLGLIYSEVHQMSGRYRGPVQADDGEVIPVNDRVGIAEEHYARW